MSVPPPRRNTVKRRSFAFTPENRAWREAQIAKYPAGRQACAVIPLLWQRAGAA